jgi:3-dehydroquinate synthase
MEITMNKLMINTDSLTYPIYFMTDFSGIADGIRELNTLYTSYIIIADSNVSPFYSANLEEELKVFEKPIHQITFLAGEKQKNLTTMELFYSRLVEVSADRKALILALGGGVTGDMAGFAAATFMRGIDFVQIPTSLLAQVDSSVGGKTGIDFQGYKNIIGAFNQPRFVYINVATLVTLPSRELYAGMGEVIKHALINDCVYYEFLENHVEQILSLDLDVLMEMIAWSCKIKKSIVDQDEKEQGARALLNFGHTIGHAIERLKEFELVHGECVAIGMHGELILSELLGFINKQVVEKGLMLMQKFHLPITTTDIDVELLYEEMFHDKKTQGNKLTFALLSDLGKSFLSKEILQKKILIDSLNTIIMPK